MKKFQLITFSMGVMLLAGVLLTACKKSNFDNTNPEVAGLMSFNLVRDKSVILGLSGSALNSTPLAFTNYTGGYQSIYPGNRTFESYDYITQDSLATTAFAFEVNKYYSAFVVGSEGAYQNVIVNDNFDSLSGSSGKAYVRYINAIDGSVSAAVTITNGGTPVSHNAAFASVSEFTEVNPGDITIAVNEGSSINASRTITVEQKTVYTVLLLSGAATADPAQIKYITNGTLDGETAGQRTTSSAKSVSIN
ncbi:MAG: DUF4397 domain-containing protein [Bacteroidota bacterium]